MRTNLPDMDGPEDEADGGEIREEGYRVSTDEGWKFVIFDPRNPVAWIMSDWFGSPPDARDEEEAEGEEEDAGD